MRKMVKRITIFALTLVMALSCFVLPANAATSAKFGTNSYCTVRISQSLLNKKGKQNATVKLYTYSMGGSVNSGGKVIVTLRDENGKLIWSGQKKGGDTLYLGDDHQVYRIYVSVYNEPVKNNILSKTITGGNNFTNSGKCYKWQICKANNCSIS